MWDENDKKSENVKCDVPQHWHVTSSHHSFITVGLSLITETSVVFTWSNVCRPHWL